MQRVTLFWGLKAGFSYWFHDNIAGAFLLGTQTKLMFSFVFYLHQNAYSNYSQWYQQYGAAYGHPHQTATQ